MNDVLREHLERSESEALRLQPLEDLMQSPRTTESIDDGERRYWDSFYLPLRAGLSTELLQHIP